MQIIDLLARSLWHVYGIRRTDLKALANLQTQTGLAKRFADAEQLVAHASLKHLWRAFEVLRGFRAAASSRTSEYAVTPALATLFAELDEHAALLRARGVRLTKHRKVTTADLAELVRALPKVKKSQRCIHFDRSFPAAARLIEVLAFEHHVRALRSIGWEAARRAKRIKGETPGPVRARAQHEALAIHAGKLAEYVDQVLRRVLPLR